MATYPSDLEIANAANKKPINEIANSIDIEKKDVHDPSNEIRSLCNYPNQILDLKVSRLRAIDAFNEAKN